MSWFSVGGFAVIVLGVLYAGEIARVVLTAQRSARVSLARALRARAQKRAVTPRPPSSAAEWIALGMTRGGTKWK